MTDPIVRDLKGIWWWGYLHSNGTVQVKSWHGDRRDYTEDCFGNDFVKLVVSPFEANTREEALAYICQRLGIPNPTTNKTA